MVVKEYETNNMIEVENGILNIFEQPKDRKGRGETKELG